MRLRLENAGPTGYDDVVARNRASYGESEATRRDAHPKSAWKIDERAAFLDRLRAADAHTLLEVGSGTGQDSVFFQEEGLEVTAVDLSPAMVEKTKAKGIKALVRDLMALDLPAESFDSVYSINTLLHVPNSELDAALRAIRAVLVPGGLFYLGVFGGDQEEGIAGEDQHVPPRFFSFRSDRQLLEYAREVFEVLDFHVYDDRAGIRFQALTLVKLA
ncbi:class I SAM-dependent methyltransferase [Paractinoplanes lichenicola]|uniref:Class I SAM-dependent methyltransferase n=1 Tax=Paractinoplanes lichenicola TaxID=2802976 RepID=A0ABS1VS64_9ACTN|nr:class I SAM-dependent methyltransferase [Actinoplanes lichenicola]MBL7257100.1 class I SAM-dependent methyltransferase [Actinoplanes lichenicola]